MLKNLLAGGGSFFGVSDAPSPYEVRKNAKIPVFGNGSIAASSSAAGPLEAAGDTAQGEIDFEKQREPKMRIAPERRAIQPEPQERRRLLDRPARNGSRRLTQAEMSLDQVKPIRNDLSDSDLELAPRRAARSSEGDLNPFAPRPIAAMGRPTHEKSGFGARVAQWFRFLKRARS